MSHQNPRTNKEVVETARKAFESRRTIPLSYRIQQLGNLLRFFEENENEISESLKKDLRKSENEAKLYEINYVKVEVQKAIDNVKKFSANEYMPLNLISPLDTAYIQKEPFGVVLIIGPWNYPYLLLLQPFIGALAAGNAAILKPSEVSSNVAALLAEKLPRYLDSECYPVVLGDAADTQDLLKNRFDYVFFTGSPVVARKIYTAAAQHLTPCTLELGGKSPCYIDKSADFEIAAKRILWGKFVNLGQICIAPDYILCSKIAEKEFLKTAKIVLNEWYGERFQENPDLPRIINIHHFNRIKKILDKTKGKIALGGKTDADDLWIDPTLIVDVNADDAVMQEEIFGPVLPIVTVDSVDEAIKFILAKPKPLALYTFSNDDTQNDKLLSHVSSGGACVNDCLWQNAWEGLPFGGIGESGIGNYHGKFSFDTFTHKKAVLRRGFGYISELLGKPRYPPYTKEKLAVFSMILSNFHRCSVSPTLITNAIWGLFGVVLAFLYIYCFHK